MTGGESVLGASAAEAVERDAAQKNDSEQLSPDDAALMADEPAARAGAPERDTAASSESLAVVAADAVQSADGEGSDLARAPVPAQGPPLEAWLMAIGAGLAVLGALLLLLAALARQTADPLLR